MIIQIRGCGGSGKTTAVRKILGIGRNWLEHYVSWKKRPAYLKHASGLVVLGHYRGKIANGCDTLGLTKNVFRLVSEINERFIVCEGLFLSEEVKRTAGLEDVRVIFLTTPLEKCLEQIALRNSQVNNHRPINTPKIVSRYARIDRARKRLDALGVLTRRASSDQAVELVVDWMKEVGVEIRNPRLD